MNNKPAPPPHPPTRLPGLPHPDFDPGAGAASSQACNPHSPPPSRLLQVPVWLEGRQLWPSSRARTQAFQENGSRITFQLWSLQTRVGSVQAGPLLGTRRPEPESGGGGTGEGCSGTPLVGPHQVPSSQRNLVPPEPLPSPACLSSESASASKKQHQAGVRPLPARPRSRARVTVSVVPRTQQSWGIFPGWILQMIL